MIILTINQSNHMEKEHSGHQLHLAGIEVWEKKILKFFDLYFLNTLEKRRNANYFR